MRKVAEFNYTVQPLDVDFNHSIRLTQVIGYLLHTAGMNAEENGFGMESLHSQNKAWVASRLAVEMYKYPSGKENFNIQTWIEDYNRVFTTRNFKITDDSNEIIGAGTSIWCMIDLETRKAIDLGDNDYSDFATGIPSLIKKPGKIPAVKDNPVSRHRIKYSDIDYNSHANSMKYIEWMIDLLPLDFFKSRMIRRIEINYINEAHFGEIVEISFAQNSSDGCIFEIRRSDDMICRAFMQFDKEFYLTENK